ncbi:DUF2790 domain-containing protein [Pseudomonas turukhanskensis]|uniref:Topoisomerase II n=1 Tax=Pseudomonas turukhanskensis TaxID=1806536 RepID=A0A9W6K861_9PSED|nr:DUF2790 domain-containing protein [Pseudomonas turukhanskensis]GLK91305.1 topoisomerase II [Pseudomonas turukhanskensis]
MKAKALVFLVLAGYVGVTLASQTSTDHESPDQPPIKTYAYGMKLDIARVISIKTDNPTCTVGPAWMTYEDSVGDRHVLEYRRMGDGC